MGSTGNSTGIHLHFGLLVFGRFDKTMNDWQDPSPFLAHALGPGNPEDSRAPAKPPADAGQSPAVPDTVETARALRWNAEETAREIQRTITDLQQTNRRLLDNVIPAAYTLEEG